MQKIKTDKLHFIPVGLSRPNLIILGRNSQRNMKELMCLLTGTSASLVAGAGNCLVNEAENCREREDSPLATAVKCCTGD